MNTKKIIGGLKVIDGNAPGFDNVLEMIKSDSAKITCVTYSSLYGFILKLVVDSTDSKYNNLSDTGDFTLSQTDFILKLVPLELERERRLKTSFATTANKNVNFGKAKDIYKNTCIKKDFIDEANIQMDIFAKSIIGNNEPICPGVADIQTLSNDTKDIVNFLRIIADKAQDEDTHKICAYLNKTCLASYKNEKNEDIKLELGVLTMAIIEDAINIYRYHSELLDSDTLTNEEIDNSVEKVYSNAISQIIILTYRIGYIHHDLHAGNVIVSKNTGKTMLIDFGRISKVGEVTKYILKDVYDDNFRGKFEKMAITYKTKNDNLFKKMMMTDLYVYKSLREINSSNIPPIIDNNAKELSFVLNKPVSDDNKVKIIIMTLRYLVLIDSVVTVYTYNKKEIKMAMEWITDGLNKVTGKFNKNVAIKVFDKLKDTFYVSKYTSIFGKNVKYKSSYVPIFNKHTGKNRLFSRRAFKSNVAQSIRVNSNSRSSQRTRKISNSQSKKSSSTRREIRST